MGKIHAAADARGDPGLVIIRRTDARAVGGLDGALERAWRYRKAGADVVFLEAPESREELARVTREAPAGMSNMFGGRCHPLAPGPRVGVRGRLSRYFSGVRRPRGRRGRGEGF